MAQMIVSIENNLTLVKSLSTYKLNDYFINIGKGMSNSQMPLMDQALCYATFFFKSSQQANEGHMMSLFFRQGA